MIELRNVGKVYQPGAPQQRVALQDIDLTVESGRFLAICGPAGSGKSTLLHLMSGLDRPTSGRVLFLGTDTASLNDEELSELRLRSVGFIFRWRNLIPELTVRDNVELPLIYAGVTRHRHQRSEAVLASVGMAGRAEDLARTIGVGDQLNVALARALINDPALIVADEPGDAVDCATARRFIATLRDAAQQRTVVLATDDQALADEADQLVHIRAGSILPAAPRLHSSPQPPPVPNARAELGS